MSAVLNNSSTFLSFPKIYLDVVTEDLISHPLIILAFYVLFK